MRLGLAQRGWLLHRALALLGSVLVVASCSCGDNTAVTSSGQGGKPASSSSGHGATTQGSPSGQSNDSSSGAGGKYVPPPQPCPGWPGWETWDDFASICPFCVPASKEALPAPITWEACDPLAGMPTGCRTMKVSWPILGTVGPFSSSFSADVVEPDKVDLSFSRLSLVEPQPYVMDLVAEADGPVLSAMIDARAKIEGCHLSHREIRHGKAAFYIWGDTPKAQPKDSPPGAVIGGVLSELHPEILAQWDTWSGAGIVTTDAYWGTYDASKIELAAWSGPLKIVYTSGDAGGLQQVRLNLWHDLALWRSSNLTYAGVMAWTAKDGVYPFITFPGDPSRGVYSMGTDGIDMVWLYGEEKGPGQGPYVKCSVMTSPFTRDPKLLKPKRLRSFPGDCREVDEWAVGCGHAAHDAGTGTMVVRLSDGVSWVIKNGATKPDFFSFQDAIAVTCKEVFVHTYLGSVANIGRVKLDALGPGTPPD